jgi:hypothetical protein
MRPLCLHTVLPCSSAGTAQLFSKTQGDSKVVSHTCLSTDLHLLLVALAGAYSYSGAHGFCSEAEQECTHHAAVAQENQ